MTGSLSAPQCASLLQQFDVGASIAEDDDLIYECRVETAVFGDLLADKLDIVRGTKGSGKTALFRLVTQYFSRTLLQENRIAIVKGVETVGDPIFLKYRAQFDELSEIEFENFWRVYFISLLTSQILGQQPYARYLTSAKDEVRQFKTLASEHGFPVQVSDYSLLGLIGWVLARIPRPKKLQATVSDAGTPEFSVELGTADRQPNPEVPVFVAPIHDALLRILKKANLSVWVMLDRLDEVFPRRTVVERTALRALLHATQAFKDPRIRLKIFLRDDIFDSITDVPEGFVGLTHVMSRCSAVLRWNRDQLLQLITSRMFASASAVAAFFKVDRDRLNRDPKYRETCFYRIFPEHLRPGGRQAKTFDWLYAHCEDGNGVVTPRDLIDLVKFAKHEQMNSIATDRMQIGTLLSPHAVQMGHHAMSRSKRENFLKAEFAHFWPAIERLHGQKADHDIESATELLGAHGHSLRDLVALGVLKHNPVTQRYTVPFLYRPALAVKQGRARKARRGVSA